LSSASSERTLKLDNASIAMQAKFIAINGIEYLAVVSDIGLHLFDSTGEEQLAYFSIAAIPGYRTDSDPVRSTYCCGIGGLPFSPLLLVGTSFGAVAIVHYDAVSKELDLERVLEGHHRSICAICVTSTSIVTGDEIGSVIVWNSDDFTLHTQFPSMGHPCSCIGVRGDTVIAGYASGVVRVYRISLGRLVFEIDAHCRALNALDLHPNQDAFATVGEDGCVCIWQLPDTKRNIPFRLASSSYKPDHMLVGVSFIRDTISQLAVVAFDRNKLYINKKPF